MKTVTGILRDYKPSNVDVETVKFVVDYLCRLLPEGMKVQDDKMTPILGAVRKICKDEKIVQEFDTLEIVGLAADICTLWNAGFLQKD